MTIIIDDIIITFLLSAFLHIIISITMWLVLRLFARKLKTIIPIPISDDTLAALGLIIFFIGAWSVM